MKALSIRGIPDELYHSLRELSKRNRRSMQQQVLCLLEQIRGWDTESPLARAEQLRARLQGRSFGDVVSDVRQERNR